MLMVEASREGASGFVILPRVFRLRMRMTSAGYLDGTKNLIALRKAHAPQLLRHGKHRTSTMRTHPSGSRMKPTNPKLAYPASKDRAENELGK